MSAERIKGEVVFICDDCDDALETGTGDFQAAQIELRSADWRAYKDDDVWRHICLDCDEGRTAGAFRSLV